MIFDHSTENVPDFHFFSEFWSPYTNRQSGLDCNHGEDGSSEEGRTQSLLLLKAISGDTGAGRLCVSWWHGSGLACQFIITGPAFCVFVWVLVLKHGTALVWVRVQVQLLHFQGYSFWTLCNSLRGVCGRVALAV